MKHIVLFVLAVMCVMALLFTPTGVNADDAGPPGGQTLVVPIDIGPAPPAISQDIFEIEEALVIDSSDTTKKVIADSTSNNIENRPIVWGGYYARSWIQHQSMNTRSLETAYCDKEGYPERSKRSDSSLLSIDCAKTIGLW